MTDEEWNKGLKEAVKELTDAMHKVDAAQEKLRMYGIDSYLWDPHGSVPGFPPRVCIRNGIKELADIMGCKTKDKISWNGKAEGLTCMTHHVQFEQTTMQETYIYRPRKEKKND